ncbi:GntR family transcriptional regulator [[Clostridium] symbiosum]|uniref:GntR family transcriptional regulator n=1 Tax=Clostridium symbiosum TaxID=1512 RepID=UPI000E519192|nr:winged helix-turn-helix domain-containing protein [[Clostridium] symbiosum]RGY61380.1 GntR family transcriptional regulator [[Clostridium] symbiosum]
MEIYLDEKSPLPKYQQITEQLYAMIRSGELKAGEKLPPERELGKENHIARGTVQMAYQELVHQGYAYAVRGSGTYISEIGNSQKEEILTKEINNIFDRAEQMGLQTREVVDIFRKQMVRHMAGDVKLMIAWVECSLESIQLAKNEYKNVENSSIQYFLLETVLKEPQLLEDNFDIIVTTTHHYETFVQAFPELVSKVEVVTTVTSSETLIGLAKISPETRVVAWTISNRFMENLLWQIRDLENINIVKTFVSDKERDEIGESLSNADLLLTTKEYSTLGEPFMVSLIQKYKKAGGRVLYFDYVFDSGSLLHLQTSICEKIAEKEKDIL